jgi:hypothetical protein
MMFIASAFAQTYVFPTSADDYAEYYPTAYVDQGYVTDWDCQSLTYAGHRGSDFGAGSFTGMDAGRDVTAAADGTVIATHDGEFDRCTTGDCYGGGGFGNYVYLEHADGKITIYGHLKQWSVLASVGDTVTCGQKLGEMGSSGYSTGPHLHFQVNNTSGYSEDPFDGPCSAPPSYWTSQGAHGALPDNSCGPPPPCEPVAELACGEIVSDSNDGVGSTSATLDYGCSEFVYSGPEMSWTFSSVVDSPVTLSLTGLSADLDLHVVGSTECAGNDCLAASTNPDAGDELVVFEAVGGTEYVVVVDGWDGATSPFTLEVACANLPEEPEETGTETGVPPTGDDDDDDEPVGDDDDDEVAQDLVPSDPKVISGGRTDCGCSQSGGPGWMALGVLLWVRRRARGGIRDRPDLSRIAPGPVCGSPQREGGDSWGLSLR